MKRAGVRVLIVVGAALVLLVAATQAGAAKKPFVVTLAHGPVTATNSIYVDMAPTGPSVGDVRSFYLPLTKPGSKAQIGYLAGTLTTLWLDKPSLGMELRTSNLIFTVGAAANQIVLGGIGPYTQTAPTVSAKSTVVRPVLGGSGKYAGARGWCLSTHFADNTWTHTFHLAF